MPWSLSFLALKDLETQAMARKTRVFPVFVVCSHFGPIARTPAKRGQECVFLFPAHNHLCRHCIFFWVFWVYPMYPGHSCISTTMAQAITYSIGQCGDSDTKRTLYRAILLAGGGALTRGLSNYLELRLRMKVPLAAVKYIDAVDVMSRPKVYAKRVWGG